MNHLGFSMGEYPNVAIKINQIHIHRDHLLDKLIWEHTSNGVLRAMDAHVFFEGHQIPLEWAKLI